jgi:hypothetical protein
MERRRPKHNTGQFEAPRATSGAGGVLFSQTNAFGTSVNKRVQNIHSRSRVAWGFPASAPNGHRRAFGQITPLVRPLKQELVSNVGNLLWVLMGTIGIVLVIACANVANLVRVRAQDRHHELAIRTALGAGRGRLTRQLLVEDLVLGLLGGGLGLLLASAALRVLSTIGAASIPRLHEITFDPIVLVLTLVLSLSSALLSGAIPATRFGSQRLALALRAGGRGSSDSRERNRARNILVVVQVALALILLVGSGLMVRTFLALRAVPPGFTDPGPRAIGARHHPGGANRRSRAGLAAAARHPRSTRDDPGSDGRVLHRQCADGR